ncbi:hypothetical protein GTO10_00640 [Candidatus Saccharibacteria bacterium]|nr:hypothetical protein [Candidatus Saccharibacteria bacterium]
MKEENGRRIFDQESLEIKVDFFSFFLVKSFPAVLKEFIELGALIFA